MVGGGTPAICPRHGQALPRSAAATSPVPVPGSRGRESDWGRGDPLLTRVSTAALASPEPEG